MAATLTLSETKYSTKYSIVSILNNENYAEWSLSISLAFASAQALDIVLDTELIPVGNTPAIAALRASWVARHSYIVEIFNKSISSRYKSLIKLFIVISNIVGI